MANKTTTAWQPEPNGRGTFGLISSCVLTLVFCVWSALHLNVPPPKSSKSRQALEKTYWIVYGIFAPELVVATAASQYITARWLKREIEKDISHRRGKDQNCSQEAWNMTQCFSAVMGGLTVNFDEEQLTLSAEGIRLLSFIGALPVIPASQIQDKSKADGLAKSVVCIQAVWMVAQVIARLVISLPVSLLEINTCGHVICALILYLLWWSKPFDILDPFVLPDTPDIEDMLFFMHACSTIGVDNITKISKVRCLRYIGPGEVNQPQKLTGPSTLVYSEISIGSTGLGDLRYFLGRQASIGVKENEYIFKVFPGEISQFCSPYFADGFQDLRLRHGEVYCRQTYTPEVGPESTLSLEQLSRIVKGADRIWTEFTSRPSYKRYFFTASPSIQSYYLGEVDYLVRHAPNLPSLTNLSLGHVNISRDTLRYVFGFTAMAYGGLHLSGWNHYFSSRVEHVLWIASCISIAGSGMLLWSYFAVRTYMRKTPPMIDKPSPLIRYSSYTVITLLVIARIYLVVEAFISLRDAPVGLYITPEWSDIFPHL
jgi:hypothetical protein